MKRRGLVALAANGALCLASPAWAQTPARLPRVGAMSPSSKAVSGENTPLGKGFLAGLGEAGWVDGRNVVVEWRYSDRQAERGRANAAELVDLQVDVLAALAHPEILAARAATSTIPITGIDLVSDPVALGWVSNLARPGGNFTGVFLDVPELVAKQLALLREALPGIRSVAVIGDPAINAAQFRGLASVAQGQRLELKPMPVRTVAEVEAAFAAVARGAAQALLLFASPLMYSERARVGALAVQYRVATISIFPELAHAGALLAFGPNLMAMWQRCGSQAGRILKGEAVASMPIERPYKFEFVVNATVAKALGIKMPAALLLRADEVIQ